MCLCPAPRVGEERSTCSFLLKISKREAGKVHLLQGILSLDENSGVYFKLLLLTTLDYQSIFCQNK